jgi:hypothetical protein
MTATAGKRPPVPARPRPAPPVPPVRFTLDSHPTPATVLDGAWWPRSADAATEVPPLVDALAGKRGEITHVLLRAADWALPHPRDVRAGGRLVRLGWYTSQPAGLVTIVTGFDQDRFDLFVVPPAATAASAKIALDTAAGPGSHGRAGELLAAVETTAAGPHV